MNLISLREAKRLGLKRYFTGKPCTLGHISERTTSNRSCLECHKEKKKLGVSIIARNLNYVIKNVGI